MQQVTKTKEHAVLSPSANERWLNCPGSISLCRGLPAGRSSKYSAEGTVAHRLAAAILNQDVAELKLLDVGCEVTQDDFDIEITDEMLEAVTVYTDFIESEIEAHGLSKYKIQKIFIEHKVKLAGKDFDGSDRTGTVDCMLLIPFTKLLVADYKHGAGVKVEAMGNTQALDYALGAYLSLSKAARIDVPYVEVVIVQPRHYAGGIERWIVSVEELLNFQKTLLAGISATKGKDAPLQAGKWCKFCPAAEKLSAKGQPMCPAIIGNMEQAVLVDFTGIDLNLPTVAGAPLEVLERIVAAEALFETLFKNARSQLQSMLELGVQSKDFKLVQAVGNETWIDVERAAPLLVKELGDSAFKRTLITPTQARKLKINTENLTYRPERDVTLVPVSDKRPAIVPKILDVTVK